MSGAVSSSLVTAGKRAGGLAAASRAISGKTGPGKDLPCPALCAAFPYVSDLRGGLEQLYSSMVQQAGDLVHRRWLRPSGHTGPGDPRSSPAREKLYAGSSEISPVVLGPGGLLNESRSRICPALGTGEIRPTTLEGQVQAFPVMITVHFPVRSFGFSITFYHSRRRFHFLTHYLHGAFPAGATSGAGCPGINTAHLPTVFSMTTIEGLFLSNRCDAESRNRAEQNRNHKPCEIEADATEPQRINI